MGEGAGRAGEDVSLTCQFRPYTVLKPVRFVPSHLANCLPINEDGFVFSFFCLSLRHVTVRGICPHVPAKRDAFYLKARARDLIQIDGEIAGGADGGPAAARMANPDQR